MYRNKYKVVDFNGMIPSDMENFALSSRKFLLMPSYYIHQEKLFDMCYAVMVSMATRPRP